MSARRLLFGVCLALLALVPHPVAAACAGPTQADLNACAAADAKRADAAMNAAYESLMTDIGPKAKEALRAAQRAWLPYRDASYALEAMGAEGGSMQPMVRARCLAQVTAARTKVLEWYLTCEEGDAACVRTFGE